MEWTECGGREYRLFQENITWSNAERTCQSHGAHLASLEGNQSRSTCVKRALQTCFRDGPQIGVAYVGLTNIFDNGTYRWVADNSEANFSYPKIPQFPLDSRHCSIYMENEQLGNVSCSVEYPFICERRTCKHKLLLLSLLVTLAV